MVYNDDRSQEVAIAPENRRHARRLPHARRRRFSRRHAHRTLRQAGPLQPLFARDQHEGWRLRRFR